MVATRVPILEPLAWLNQGQREAWYDSIRDIGKRSPNLQMQRMPYLKSWCWLWMIRTNKCKCWVLLCAGSSPHEHDEGQSSQHVGQDHSYDHDHDHHHSHDHDHDHHHHNSSLSVGLGIGMTCLIAIAVAFAIIFYRRYRKAQKAASSNALTVRMGALTGETTGGPAWNQHTAPAPPQYTLSPNDVMSPPLYSSGDEALVAMAAGTQQAGDLPTKTPLPKWSLRATFVRVVLCGLQSPPFHFMLINPPRPAMLIDHNQVPQLFLTFESTVINYKHWVNVTVTNLNVLVNVLFVIIIIIIIIMNTDA